MATTGNTGKEAQAVRSALTFDEFVDAAVGAAIRASTKHGGIGGKPGTLPGAVGRFKSRLHAKTRPGSLRSARRLGWCGRLGREPALRYAEVVQGGAEVGGFHFRIAQATPLLSL